MWVRSMDWEDPLKEGMATHFSILGESVDREAQCTTVHRIAESDMTEVT